MIFVHTKKHFSIGHSGMFNVRSQVESGGHKGLENASQSNNLLSMGFGHLDSTKREAVRSSVLYG